MLGMAELSYPEVVAIAAHIKAKYMVIMHAIVRAG
jgi:hypothetical protein